MGKRLIFALSGALMVADILAFTYQVIQKASSSVIQANVVATGCFTFVFLLAYALLKKAGEL